MQAITLDQAKATLKAAFTTAPMGAKMEAFNAARAEIIGSMDLVEVNPYGGNYTRYPKGYRFACGSEVFRDWVYCMYADDETACVGGNMPYMMRNW
jgi:hypothetical protein